MIEVAARWVSAAAGVWLILLSVFMVVAPHRSLRALAAMGGTPVIHFGEMAIRLAAGVALVLAATASRFPQALGLTGWFLVVSALILMALPRRWHAAYSTWWAGRMPPWAVRLAAPFSLVAGGALICR